MRLDLPYVQHRNGKSKPGQVTGHFRYRRKVPLPLIEPLGKRWIVKPLGRTWKEVVRKYDRVHAEAEAELAAAARGAPIPASPTMTALERYQAGRRTLAEEWGQIADDDPALVGDVIEGRYRLYADKDEDGAPLSYRAPLSDKDAATLSLLALHRVKPSPTFRDAVRLYLKDRVDGTSDETKKRQRVERVQGHLEEALGRDPVLTSITRPDARAVRDHMADDGDMAPATVHRYLNDIRAIINHAVKEIDGLAGMTNHFNKLEVKKPAGQVSKDDRKPFTRDQLAQTRARILDHASGDLRRIWRMLEGTGCRLAEVSGAMVADLHLDHETPYLDLKFHPHRRLKNVGSVRRVPLVGDALAAAREALQAAGADPLLFPAYATRPDTVSAALMKHVRKVVADKKVTSHSLRHTMKDRLIEAEVPKDVQDMILGHSGGAVSEAYGGPEARLRVTAKALAKAI